MSHCITIWVPRPPDRANARQHWATANRAKRAYHAELDQRASVRHGIPPAPARPIPRATVAVYWHYPDRRHHLDPDNALANLKPLADWLVRRGYLANDTATHVRWLPIESVVGAPTPPLCTVQLVLTPTP